MLGITKHIRVKQLINWKIFFPMFAIAGLLGWGLNALFGISFWWSFGIVVGAIVLNGIIAEIEDRTHGGFLNPNKDPKETK